MDDLLTRFQQLAQTQQASQASQAQQAQQAAPAQQGGDDLLSRFQQMAAGAQPAPPVSTAKPPDPNDLHPGWNPVKQVGAAFEGIGEGVLGTAGNISDLIDKGTGMQPGVVNKWLHAGAGDDYSHGPSMLGGQMGEGIGEFFMGSEALKAIPIAERFTAIGKLMKVLEAHPVLGSALENGLLGGVQGGVKSESWAGAGEGAALGAATGAATTWGMGKLAGKLSSNEELTLPEAGSREHEEFMQDLRNQEEWKGKEQDAQTPVARKAYAATNKAPIKEGAEELSAPEPYDYYPSSSLKAGIFRTAQDAARESGLDYAAPPRVRDAIGTVARSVYDSAKADYDVLDQASGGDWKRWDNKIKAVQTAARNVTDDDAYEALESRLADLTQQRAQFVEDLQNNPAIDKGILKRADQTYKRSMALHEVNNAVRMSTKPTAVARQGVQDVVNADSFAARIAKMNDTPVNGGQSRLEQALGKEGADALVRTVEDAQMAALHPDLPSSATGKQALLNIITPNTRPNPGFINRKFVRIEWKDVASAFEKLGIEKQREMFGGDLTKTQKFIYSQASKQRALDIGKKTVGWGAGIGVGDYLVHRALTALGQ